MLIEWGGCQWLLARFQRFHDWEELHAISRLLFCSFTANNTQQYAFLFVFSPGKQPGYSKLLKLIPAFFLVRLKHPNVVNVQPCNKPFQTFWTMINNCFLTSQSYLFPASQLEEQLMLKVYRLLVIPNYYVLVDTTYGECVRC